MVRPVAHWMNQRMFSIFQQKMMPRMNPASVPTMPIDAPVIRNTRIIEPLVAPIVRSTAMSRPLSFTSIMMPEMMFNAATTMISDRMMNITDRSTSSTRKKVSLRCFQSDVWIVGPPASLIAPI